MPLFTNELLRRIFEWLKKSNKKMVTLRYISQRTLLDGCCHKKRSVFDKLTPEQAAQTLRAMVEAVAYGTASESRGTKVLKHKGMEVFLGRKGGNSYVVTAYGRIRSPETRSSGQPDRVGQTLTSAVARDQNLSELVKIIADNKLLFKGDEYSYRKAAIAHNKAKKSNYNKVHRDLLKSWGTDVTNQLLKSGKVVICPTTKDFIDTMVRDEHAKMPNATESVIRESLKEFEEGTEGMYDDVTGKVYLNAEAIDEGDAGAVLAHEVAVHAAKDSEFQDLIVDLEDRVFDLMSKGLKSKNPAKKKFWEDVRHRLVSADLLDENGKISELDDYGREELLAYFMTVYTQRHGVLPQSLYSEIMQVLGKLKDWLLNFLGISRLNDRQVADILNDVVRVMAEEGANRAAENLSGKKASRSKVTNIGGKYANPNAEEHARYAEQLRREEPRDFRPEEKLRGRGSLSGQSISARYARARVQHLVREPLPREPQARSNAHERTVEQRTGRDGGRLRVLARWRAPEKLKQVYQVERMKK